MFRYIPTYQKNRGIPYRAFLHSSSEQCDMHAQKHFLRPTPRSSPINNPLRHLYFRHSSPPTAQLALYADDTAILTESWQTDTIARRLTHGMTTLPISPNGTSVWTSIKQKLHYLLSAALNSRAHFSFNTPLSFGIHIRYLGLVLNSRLLFTKHSVIHKATGTFLKLFPFLASNTLSPHNRLTLYKLLIRAILTLPRLEQYVY